MGNFKESNNVLGTIALVVIINFFSSHVFAETPTTAIDSSPQLEATHPVSTQPIAINDINKFKEYPAPVQKLITNAANLSEKNLTYLYGSANPDQGGMDCSGTIYYLLRISGLTEMPRTASDLYQWVVKEGKFFPVTNQDFNSTEFSNLKPGDLLFWKGTYATNHTPPISHVMLYLGKNKENQPVMFGASDGRTYQGKQMWGVSIFDFKLPKATSSAQFIGYSCIPNLTCTDIEK